MTPPEFWPDPGPFIGPDASIREYRRLFEMFRGIEVTVSDIVSHEAWAIGHYRGVMEIEVPEPGLPESSEFTGVHRFENDLFAESHYRSIATRPSPPRALKKAPGGRGRGDHRGRRFGQPMCASAILAEVCGVSHPARCLVQW